MELSERKKAEIAKYRVMLEPLITQTIDSFENAARRRNLYDKYYKKLLALRKEKV